MFFVKFQRLAQIIAICQILIPCYLSVSVLTFSQESMNLDVCLGNYEQYFVRTYNSYGIQVCDVGKSWQRILCGLSVVIHLIFSSNVLDAFFLFLCFNKIKYQTEKSKELIGERAYDVRKRYVIYHFCEINFSIH